ncbi:MAG: RluA family pseudouridine synthase [Atopobiaceae bacterium]
MCSAKGGQEGRAAGEDTALGKTVGANAGEPVSKQPYAVTLLDDEGVMLRVGRRTFAVALARELLHSKAEASRVLAAGQLEARAEEAPDVQETGRESDMGFAAQGGWRTLLPNDVLVEGTVVRLRFARNGEPTAQAETSPRASVAGAAKGSARAAAARPFLPCDVRVLYEDPILLAVDKPAGILVHGDGTGVATLTDLVRQHLLQEGSAAAGDVQAVQRLDVDTSGVVLFSKSKEFQPALDALVAEHGVGGMTKRYLAVVRGRVDGRVQRLDQPLGRDRHDARRMRVSPSGKPAVTWVRGLASRRGLSLVECQLGTGRKHQIRVHLSANGHPIVGDVLYGGAASAQKRSAGGRGAGAHGPGGAERTGGLMLHAAYLRFVHPVTGEAVEVQAPWPSRFDAYFSQGDLPGGLLPDFDRAF